LTHPTVDRLTAQVRVIADSMEGSITYPTEAAATAVVLCFLSKLRAEAPAEGEPSCQDVPLEDLVTEDGLPDVREIFENAERRDEWVRDLRYYTTSIPRVRPQADGRLGILLVWVHPDQDEPLRIDEPRLVTARMAYLSRNEDGEWRLDRIPYPPPESGSGAEGVRTDDQPPSGAQ
jgi:hypothetical protein